MSRLLRGANLARRWGVALAIGAALAGVGRAQVGVAKASDPVSEAVMKARGDLTYVKRQTCSSAVDGQRRACATLQDATAALDRTKIREETKSSATDVPHGLAATIESLDDAEHLIVAEPGSSTDVSVEMLRGVRAARVKVQQAQKETAATPNRSGWQDRLKSFLPSSGGAQSLGISILSFVALFLNLVAVLGLAYLIWLGPLARNADRTAADERGSGEFDQIRVMATQAAATYKTLLDQNGRWQAQVEQLAVENLGLRRQLEQIRGGERVETMEPDEEFGRKGSELEDGEAVEPALTKYGPGIAPIVMDAGPGGKPTGGERTRDDRERLGQNAESHRMERKEAEGEAVDLPSDTLALYRKARLTGDPDEESRFKKKYTPCLSLTCTNLAQRGIAGGRLTFKEDARGSFLAVTAQEGRMLLFPQFRTEFPYARGLMEGVFAYPDGEIRELNLARAAEVEPVGDEWVLLQPGHFEHA